MYSLTFFSKHYSVLARVMYYCKCTLAFICTFTVCNSTYHSIELFKANNVPYVYCIFLLFLMFILFLGKDDKTD